MIITESFLRYHGRLNEKTVIKSLKGVMTLAEIMWTRKNGSTMFFKMNRLEVTRCQANIRDSWIEVRQNRKIISELKVYAND